MPHLPANASQIAAHVQTRDNNTCRSKAQKHFIKLFRANLPLPAKVAESGAGYTLSGLPLDPNSAAARPYLQANGAAGSPATMSASPSQLEPGTPASTAEAGAEPTTKPASEPAKKKCVVRARPPAV